jgi:hypothetical protein
MRTTREFVGYLEEVLAAGDYRDTELRAVFMDAAELAWLIRLARWQVTRERRSPP